MKLIEDDITKLKKDIEALKGIKESDTGPFFEFSVQGQRPTLLISFGHRTHVVPSHRFKAYPPPRNGIL